MKLAMIAAIMACLLIGTAGGYGVGYLIYEPVIKSYVTQISGLTFEVSSLSQTVSAQEVEISDLMYEVAGLSQTISTQEVQISDLMYEVSALTQTVSSQETQISTLESEKTRLQADLSIAQEQTRFYEARASVLNSQLSSLQMRMNNILGITVTQYYQWTYQWQTWKWNLSIPLSIYVEYRERPRPLLGASYVDMAKDPNDDSYIDKMIRQINSSAVKAGFTESQKVNFVIAFVQSLPYTVDIETTPYDEYPRYPVETLFNRGGDCEDTSILVAALLDRMGYDVALLLLKNAKHMAVGVSIPSIYGSYYKYDGKKYFYLETTGDGWQMGKIPTSITDTKAQVYPLRG